MFFRAYLFAEPLPPPVIVVNNDDEEEEEEKKDLMTPITALSFTPTLHIPEYFGLVSIIIEELL